MKEERPIINLIGILMKRRIFIIKFVGIVIVLSCIISIFLVNKYTAAASILPPSNEQESMFGLLAAGISGSLGGLARIGGSISGMATPSELFSMIMKSERIQNELIEKYNLIKEFKVKTMTDARKELNIKTAIEVTAEGIVYVRVTYKNKHLAANIANSYIEELDKFNTETAMTTGKKYRIFIEQRLNSTSDSLQKAEEALRTFQEQHRTVALNIETEKVIEAIVKLKSEIVLREAQRGTMADISNLNNPYVTNLDRELYSLKQQLRNIEFGNPDTTKKGFGAGFAMPLTKLPNIALEYARLLRDVKVQEAIYELLVQQYEQAKIMEVKDTPTVQFLDRASPPEKKSFPKRSRIVLFFAALGFLISIGYCLIAEYVRTLSTHPQWQEYFQMIKDDYGKIRSFLLRFRKNK